MAQEEMDSFYEVHRLHGGLPIEVGDDMHRTMVHILPMEFKDSLKPTYLTMDAYNVASLSFTLMVGEYNMNKALDDINQHQILEPHDEYWSITDQALQERHEELIKAQKKIKHWLDSSDASYKAYRISNGLTPFNPPVFSLKLLHKDESNDIFELRKKFYIVSVGRILSANYLENYADIINGWMAVQQDDGRFHVESEDIWRDETDVNLEVQDFLERKIKKGDKWVKETWAEKQEKWDEERIAEIKHAVLNKATEVEDTVMEDVKEAPAVRKSRGRNAAKTKAAPKAPKAPKAPAPKAAKAGKEKKTLDAFKQCYSTIYTELWNTEDADLPTQPSGTYVSRAFHAGTVPSGEFSVTITQNDWDRGFRNADDRVWRRCGMGTDGRTLANTLMANGLTRTIAIARWKEIIEAFLAGTADQ